MQTQRLEILGVTIGIDKFANQYRAIYSHPGGRVFRRLGVRPSPGVTRFADEKPEVIMQVVTASNIISNQLADAGQFSARGRYLFRDVMDEFLQWHEQYRNNPQMRSHAQPAITAFGQMRLNKITRSDVRAWITDMAQQYQHNTVRNRVNPAKQCINWLIREGRFDGSNPFENVEWKCAKQTGHEVKAIITPEEWQLIRNMTASDPYLEQAVTLAFFTGLRPSEIYRVQPGDFDHEQFALTVHVRKTGQHTRLIAVPACLSAWAVNRGQWHELNLNTVQHKMIALKQKHPALLDLCMASFRKSFAATMEQHGADHETIDAHQGRFQNSVIAKYYLRDKYRAVRLMRPYIGAAFDGGKVDILRAAH